MAILAVNAGSSSLKFSIHPLLGGTAQPGILTGNIEGLEPGGAARMSWGNQTQRWQSELPVGGQDPFLQALRGLAELLAKEASVPAIEGIAHRVVHGGAEFSSSVLVTDAILERLAAFNSLAPLHQPHNLLGIRAFRQVFPALPQVACFDTAFHSTISELDYSFALPRELARLGLRRYGFHGLSYQYVIGVLQRCSALGNGRVVMAHLGNGASLCGTRHGLSVATTMGFSALDGLMMGTRCGALDPGVMLYLMEQGWDHARLQNLLYKQSGLLGVSGISADMRRLRSDSGMQARKAIDLFTHRVVRECGALAACLGGLDLLAFSGGIGEHDVVLRAEVGEKLGWMGVEIDAERNRLAIGESVAPIHRSGSPVEVWVVPTDEGIVAASQAAALLGGSKAS
jgi:acetate kinase